MLLPLWWGRHLSRAACIYYFFPLSVFRDFSVPLMCNVLWEFFWWECNDYFAPVTKCCCEISLHCVAYFFLSSPMFTHLRLLLGVYEECVLTMRWGFMKKILILFRSTMLHLLQRVVWFLYKCVFLICHGLQLYMCLRQYMCVCCCVCLQPYGDYMRDYPQMRQPPPHPMPPYGGPPVSLCMLSTPTFTPFFLSPLLRTLFLLELFFCFVSQILLLFIFFHHHVEVFLLCIQNYTPFFFTTIELGFCPFLTHILRLLMGALSWVHAWFVSQT
jgi:hypothetical protein